MMTTVQQRAVAARGAATRPTFASRQRGCEETESMPNPEGGGTAGTARGCAVIIIIIAAVIISAGIAAAITVAVALVADGAV